jgi:haloalkane dehalogenase
MVKQQKITRRGLTLGLAGLSLSSTLPSVAWAMGNKINVLRTPDERFEDLPDFDFDPHYLAIPHGRGEVRMHYLDEGDPDGDVILLLHGQGQWAYAYRHMIPLLVAEGFRVVVPDYIGFGRSDKLTRDEDYTFTMHVNWITSFIQQMNFKNCTAYMFDWGGYFGLRVMAEHPELFDKVALSNTQLPIASSPSGAKWFKKWRAGIMKMPTFPMGKMVNSGATTKLSPKIIEAYNAPYPDETYKTGPRRFPFIVPISEDMPSIPENRAAWEVLKTFEKPVLTIFSDPVMGMSPTPIQEHIPGSKGQPHAGLKKAGFYITDDRSDDIAKMLIQFARS